MIPSLVHMDMPENAPHLDDGSKAAVDNPTDTDVDLRRSKRTRTALSRVAACDEDAGQFPSDDGQFPDDLSEMDSVLGNINVAKRAPFLPGEVIRRHEATFADFSLWAKMAGIKLSYG